MAKKSKSSDKGAAAAVVEKPTEQKDSAPQGKNDKGAAEKGKGKSAAGKPSKLKESAVAAGDAMATAAKSRSKKEKKAPKANGQKNDAPTTASSIAAVLAGGNVSEAASALFTVTSAVAIVPPKLSTPAVPDQADSEGEGRGRKRKAKAALDGDAAKKAKDDDEAEDAAPRRPIDPEREKRTVFVGNVPVAAKKPAIKNMFRAYGAIESIRFRSVALSDPHIPKKVGFIKKDFHPERSAMNAYVVFKARESAEAALAANGSLLDGKHITCDIAANKEHDTRHTVFVGGLPFNTEDEALREHFGQCGAIHSVRVIRDKRTGIGKGIAYVRFMDAGAVGLAERLHQTEFGGKTIRVTKAVDEQTLARQKARKEKKSFQGARSKASHAGKKAASAKVIGRGSRKQSNKGHKPPKKKGKTGGQMLKKLEANKRKAAKK